VPRSKTSLFVIFSIASIHFTGHTQPELPSELKSCVYRLFKEQGVDTIEASGVLFSEGKHDFLITNKHFVQVDSSRFIDSIYISMNALVANNEVISGPRIRKILLKKDSINYLFRSNSCEDDLVLISIGENNSDLDGETVYTVPSKYILYCSPLVRRWS